MKSGRQSCRVPGKEEGACTAPLCQLRPRLSPWGLCVCRLQLCDNQLTAPPAPKGHPQLLPAGGCRDPGRRMRAWVGNTHSRAAFARAGSFLQPSSERGAGEGRAGGAQLQGCTSTAVTVHSWRPSAAACSLFTGSGMDGPIVSLTCTASDRKAAAASVFAVSHPAGLTV